MTTSSKKVALAAAAALLTAATAACGDSAAGGGDSSDPVVIGTTLSLTGPLGPLGSLQQQGYEQAVAMVNDEGGLDVDGTQRQVELQVVDNQSDPDMASQQARELVLQDGAVALLGPCTPPITIPVAQVAEVQRVPIIANCTPVGAFTAGNEAGWNYAWDIFFAEQDQATSVFEAFLSGGDARNVAIFTDTEPDGVIERELYKQAAAEAGFTVVGDYSFPVGTSEFSSFINDAKANGAQLVVAQTTPPDGIALWQQMKALGLAPQMAFSAKAATSGAWWEALGQTSEGTLTEGFWAPELGNAGTEEIMASLGTSIETKPDLGLAVVALTAAQVLFDAIEAGGTDADALNEAIGATDGDYPLGRIQFDDDHTFVSPHLITQWTQGDTVQIIPAEGGTTPQVPATGLAQG